MGGASPSLGRVEGIIRVATRTRAKGAPTEIANPGVLPPGRVVVEGEVRLPFRGTRSVESGPDGRFVCDELPPGRYTVRLQVLPRHRPVGAPVATFVPAPAGMRDVVLLAEPLPDVLATLLVRVATDGKGPAAGAIVTLGPDRVRCDPGGEAVLDNVAMQHLEGSVEVTPSAGVPAWRCRVGEARALLDLDANPPTLAVRVPAHLVTLSGRVVTADGSPLPAVRVRLESAEQESEVPVGASGDFRLDAVWPGRKLVSTIADGHVQVDEHGAWMPVLQLCVDEDAPRDALDLLLRLTAGRQVEILIVDGETGAPVPGAAVSVDHRTTQSWRQGWVAADERGIARVCVPLSGSVRARALAPELGYADSADYTLPPAGRIEIRLHSHEAASRRAVPVAGHVQWPGADVGPALPVRVLVVRIDKLDSALQGRWVAFSVAEDGTFDLGGNPPGRYGLVVLGQPPLGFSPVHVFELRPADPPRHVELEVLQADATINGTVRSPSGVPLPGVEVLRRPIIPGAGEPTHILSGTVRIAVTALDGSFSAVADRGPVVLQFWRTDCRIRRLEIRAPTAMLDVVLEPDPLGRPPGVLTARFVDADTGRPLAGVRVVLRVDPSGDPVDHFVLDDERGFSCSTDGFQYVLEASRDGYEPIQETIKLPAYDHVVRMRPRR